ncbi:MAG: hypothetical protein ACYC0X_23415 [Pirellulaceae bacterium]
MAKTIDLESDVYAVAESLARQHHCTVSAVVNQALRQALLSRVPLESQPSEQTPPHLTIDPGTGLPSVKCSRTLTSDDVRRCEMDTI